MGGEARVEYPFKFVCKFLFHIFCYLHGLLTYFPTLKSAHAKRRLSNERRNSILMTCQYPDLGSASDWLKRYSLAFQPIRSTT